MPKVQREFRTNNRYDLDEYIKILDDVHVLLAQRDMRGLREHVELNEDRGCNFEPLKIFMLTVLVVGAHTT